MYCVSTRSGEELKIQSRSQPTGGLDYKLHANKIRNQWDHRSQTKSDRQLTGDRPKHMDTHKQHIQYINHITTGFAV